MRGSHLRFGTRLPHAVQPLRGYCSLLVVRRGEHSRRAFPRDAAGGDRDVNGVANRVRFRACDGSAPTHFAHTYPPIGHGGLGRATVDGLQP
jgi:hypothetical protein